jgi:hypothetical protein
LQASEGASAFDKTPIALDSVGACGVPATFNTKPSKMIVFYFKTSLYLREDSEIFCEGKYEQKWRLDCLACPSCLNGFVGLNKFIELAGLVGPIDIVGQIDLNGLV